MKVNLHPNPGAFGGIEPFPEYATARYVVLPVPFDLTSTWLKGADRGPDAILEASANMELYDIPTGIEAWRDGIVTLAPVDRFTSAEDLVERVDETATALLQDGKTVIGIGGNHSVAIGLIRAHHRCFDNLSVLQFDAHSDTRDEYENSRFSHACVMARAAELGDYVQVGIRSMEAGELTLLQPVRTFFAHQIRDRVDFIPRVVERLTENVYVTIDLDCFDPALVPSTGTPEPGGLHWYQVLDTLTAVCRAKNVVGFDVTELAPNPSNKAPDFLAAKLIYQFISLLTAKRKGLLS
ncbi:MAG: agmatinase [Candidatus Neomarinimicrobiota bacterium]